MLEITFKCISNQNHSYYELSQIDLFQSNSVGRAFSDRPITEYFAKISI